MSVIVIYSVIWAEVSSDISVFRKDNELVGILDVVHTVAVLGFRLVESFGIVYDIACALFILLSRRVVEIAFKL